MGIESLKDLGRALEDKKVGEESTHEESEDNPEDQEKEILAVRRTKDILDDLSIPEQDYSYEMHGSTARFTIKLPEESRDQMRATVRAALGAVSCDFSSQFIRALTQKGLHVQAVKQEKDVDWTEYSTFDIRKKKKSDY